MVVDSQSSDGQQHTGVKTGHEQAHVLNQHGDQAKQKTSTQRYTCVQAM